MTDNPQDIQPDGFRLVSRVRILRGDERGSLTLLAGMMVFLVTIFVVIAFDTNMAIVNRITAQNAVDSAADSAALWEARGCNLLQNLNNLHYTVDEGLAIAEDAASGACIAAAALQAAEIALDAFFGAGEALRVPRYILCGICATMPAFDLAQQKFYSLLMPIEQGIVDMWPYVAFANANSCAQGSGADTVGDSLGGALQSLLGGMGVNLSGLGSMSGVLGGIPIYAMPLDPDDFGLFDPSTKGLYVTRKDNNGWPLSQPQWIGTVGEGASDFGCSDAPVQLSEWESNMKDMGWDGNYGWDDQYFFGWPGFSTWIAGKKQQNEVLGLGNLAWLNGGMQDSDYQQNMADTSRVMYHGTAFAAGGSQIQIPGYIAIASSQVEGTPVICNGSADAQGHLIKVYLPGNPPRSGEQGPLYIFH